MVIEGGNARGKCPPAPSWLSANAKAEWKRAAPQLHSRGLLYPEILGTLESYCAAMGAVRDLEETMQKDGRIVRTKDGPKPHPAFRMQVASLREARLLACELGLTPYRRGADGGNKGSAPDGWDDDLLA
jgi:P27 family predicted phage terminase small subunit